MLDHHVPVGLQAGEVDPGVPQFQLAQIEAKLRQRGRGQLQPQGRGPLLQQVHGIRSRWRLGGHGCISA